MYEHAPRQQEALSPEQAQQLEQTRYLTEVDAISKHLDLKGNVPEFVALDTKQNMATALCETAMPFAVTTTYHRVEHREGKSGQKERVISWLGKNAVDLAVRGKQYYFSEAAYDRVDVEIQEAMRAQESLQAGTAQVFISPKMSRKDASPEVAKAEHMYDDDSLRVSYAVTDESGVIVARKMQALLVRDIPLSAWVDMLQDEQNIFGRSFDLEDAESALSVMKLFAQLDLPADKLQDGPIGLVAAVLPYIREQSAYLSVQNQLLGFRNGQDMYQREAASKAEEWFAFDLELAKSLKQGKATGIIYSHIHTRAHDWNDEALKVIQKHSIGNGHYRMSRELATLLEKSKLWELQSRAAVVTKNERALEDVSVAAQEHIVMAENRVREMKAAGLPAEDIYRAQLALARTVVGQNIRTGGGCAGMTESAFGGSTEGMDSTTDVLTGLSELASPYRSSKAENKSDWKWKKGICQVKSCATRPGQTEVGPCSVCRHCQAEFDAGRDPTKGAFAKATTKVRKKTAEYSVKLFAAAQKVGGKVLDVATGRKKG